MIRLCLFLNHNFKQKEKKSNSQRKMQIFALLCITFTILICTSSSRSLEKLQVESNISSDEHTGFQSDEASSREIKTDALLSDKTLAKLADAMHVHPATLWKLKHRFKSGQDLHIDESKFKEFIDYPHSERLLNKLSKVLKGEDIFLTVIGGSNSGGAGIQEDEQGGAEGIFPYVITDWWAKAITPITGSELQLNLVSIGGTGAHFYQYCHHVYLENSPDLVMLEASVNDVAIVQGADVHRCTALEQLTRQLLLYSSEPALIYVNLYNPGTQDRGCENLDDYGQKALSQAYEITSIRWRDLVCPMTDQSIRKPITGVNVACRDLTHINLLGHAQISLMFINIIRDVLLKFMTSTMLAVSNSPAPKLPKPLYIKDENKLISMPHCWTTITPNYLKPIHNNFNVQVVKHHLFQYWSLIRMGYECKWPVCRTDAFGGWIGSTIGARLIVSFTVPQPAPGYLPKAWSVVFATRTCSYCGKAKVWIDNDFDNGIIVDSKINSARTTVNIVALRVKPGEHTLTINVLEPANVTLAGVMLGPPDGSY